MAEEKKQDTQVKDPAGAKDKNSEVKVEDKTEDDGIIVESVEDDMRANGIEPEPEKPKGEQVNEEPGKDGNPPENKDQNPKAEPPRKSRAQRRIERQQRTIHQLRAKLDAVAASKNKKLTDQENKVDESSDEDEINIDDYDTYDEYIEALEAKEAEKAKGTTKKPKGEQAKPERQEPGDDGRSQQIIEVMADGEEDYEDFKKIVTDKDLELSEDLLTEALRSDEASDVLYYLGQHKEDTAKFSRMTPEQMEREIIKIEIKLESQAGNKDKNEPKAKKLTNAPEPINPVSDGTEHVKTLDDKDISFSEYEKLANAKRRSNTGGFL